MPRRPRDEAQLFRFEVFCTSKQLGDVLAALTNRVTEISPPQLVVNAKLNGRARISAATGGTLLEMFAEHLRKTKPEKLQVQDVKQWIENAGIGNPNSSQYLLKNALANKLIRKVGRDKGTGHPIVYAPTATALAPKE